MGAYENWQRHHDDPDWYTCGAHSRNICYNRATWQHAEPSGGPARCDWGDALCGVHTMKPTWRHPSGERVCKHCGMAVVPLGTSWYSLPKRNPYRRPDFRGALSKSFYDDLIQATRRKAFREEAGEYPMGVRAPGTYPPGMRWSPPFGRTGQARDTIARLKSHRRAVERQHGRGSFMDYDRNPGVPPPPPDGIALAKNIGGWEPWNGEWERPPDLHTFPRGGLAGIKKWAAARGYRYLYHLEGGQRPHWRRVPTTKANPSATVPCPGCGEHLSIPDDFTEGPCPNCGVRIRARRDNPSKKKLPYYKQVFGDTPMPEPLWRWEAAYRERYPVHGGAYSLQVSGRTPLERWLKAFEPHWREAVDAYSRGDPLPPIPDLSKRSTANPTSSGSTDKVADAYEEFHGVAPQRIRKAVVNLPESWWLLGEGQGANIQYVPPKHSKRRNTIYSHAWGDRGGGKKQRSTAKYYVSEDGNKILIMGNFKVNDPRRGLVGIIG